MTTLAVHNLSFFYDDHCVFSNVSFDITAGCGLVVRGKNGCGKSTLLRLIAGLLSPETGTIDWFHENNICYLGHLSGLKSHMTPYEHLFLSAQMMTSLLSLDEHVWQSLTLYNLSHHAHIPVGHLSAGFQRRVALARVHLLGQKKTWILDEPLTNLDDETAELFLKTVETHLNQGNSVLLSSHRALALKKMPEYWLHA